jgi:Tfp pilus assembly protein PilO
MTAPRLWRRVFTERRTVLLPLLVAFVVNVGVLALGVVPLRQSVKNAEQAASDARLNLANARRADFDAKAARAGKERADVEMKKFYSEILPRDYQSAQNLVNFWLGKTARESGVVFKTGTYTSKAVQDSGLTRFIAQVTLVGEYAEIRRFLYEVETAQEFAIIESVELAQAGSMQASGQLELQLDVATYYVTPPPRGGAQ